MCSFPQHTMTQWGKLAEFCEKEKFCEKDKCQEMDGIFCIPNLLNYLLNCWEVGRENVVYATHFQLMCQHRYVGIIDFIYLRLQF